MEAVPINFVMVLIGFLLGTILGSFAKVLADRSISYKSFWGRSYCVHCKHTLAWYDLFPILSFIFLRGKCRYCHKKINIEYLLVEVVMGLLIGYLLFQNFDNFPLERYSVNFQFLLLLLDFIFKTFFVSILLVLFLTDLKKMFIPDRIILPAIVVSIMFITVIIIIKVIFLYYFLNRTRVGQLLLPPHSDYFQRHALMTAEPLLGAILTAILVGGFFWGLVIITKGKGMGGGDVKLGAFIGLVLGFPQGILAIISSFILGALFSLILIALKKKHFGQSIPFGPFLVLGSLISLFWGRQILGWYLKLGT